MGRSHVGLVTLVAFAAVSWVVAGCGPSAAPAPSASASPRPTIAPPTATQPSIAPSPSTTAGRTFPPSQVPIEPGTYRWTGFEPAITVAVGSGWEVGHRHPEFFDLFRGSDFPSVSFARFTQVYEDATSPVNATDAQDVLTALRGHSDVILSDIGPIEMGGLSGQQFALTTTAAQTPLFTGPTGVFKMDPEFENRYRLLDLPDGRVLFIGVHARAGGVDAAAALADPILASFAVEP